MGFPCGDGGHVCIVAFAGVVDGEVCPAEGGEEGDDAGNYGLEAG